MVALHVLLGLVLSAIVAALAYERGSLARGGVLGAILVGTVVFAGGGVGWGLLLILFFVTSSVLSYFQARAKEALADKFQKGRRRDLGQVLANGGWGAALALAFGFFSRPVLFAAFVGAMAAVTADTWATELGVLSRTPPRLITNGQRVAVGTSGGVTLLGMGVSLFAGLLMGIFALALSAVPGLVSWEGAAGSWNSPKLVLVGAASGLLGSLCDSLLGATVQAIYYCDADQKETESARHRCGRQTRLIRGWRWFDNDWVNLSASVVGSVIAAGLYWALA